MLLWHFLLKHRFRDIFQRWTPVSKLQTIEIRGIDDAAMSNLQRLQISMDRVANNHGVGTSEAENCRLCVPEGHARRLHVDFRDAVDLLFGL